MRARRVGFIASFLAIAYVSLAGCGDDDTSSIPDQADTGTDAQSTTDGNVSKADTSSNPPDTSVSDTSVSDSTADTSVDDDGSITDANSTDANDASRSPEFTGSACKVAADCYQTFDAQSLKGAPYCIDKVTDGYCTHECQTDADCCAIPGECKTKLKQVCAPFENTGKNVCVLSCEDADIKAGNDAGLTDAGTDPNTYCHQNVSSEFGCRSTGGGSNNKKACFPTGTGPTDAGTDASDASDTSDASDAADAADADGG